MGWGISLITILFATQVHAGTWDNIIFHSDGRTPAPLEEITSQIHPGSIVVMGEQHDLQSHHDNQLTMMKSLQSFWNSPVSVALEMFSYPDQENLSAYVKGYITSEELRSLVNMDSKTFNFYLPLINFAKNSGGNAYAVNLPRTISSKIAKVGIEGLTPEEKQMLPPQFQEGNPYYKQRFIEAMGGNHSGIPSEKIDRYFKAQSSWDDTMAYWIQKAQAQHPQHTVVAIVGNFHVEYGGGTPDRLTQRGAHSVFSIPQVESSHYTQQGLIEKVTPHSQYGLLGHFIWVTGEPQTAQKARHFSLDFSRF